MTSEVLLHELWEYIEDGAVLWTLCCAGPLGDAARAQLSPDARLVWTVRGWCHFETMTLYYKRQGWGCYTTDQPWDLEPYPVEWITEQRAFFNASAPAGNEARL